MAKSQEQIDARNLRKIGVSINKIAEKLSVSKSSVSIWCRDIKLTKKQIQRLHDQMVVGGYAGRLKGAHIQRDRKQQRIQYYLNKAKKDIGKLKKREMLMVGLGLYWGEGSKHSSARFYNSNPQAVVFMMKWFREILKVEEGRFLMYININQIHSKRLKDVIRYWSRVTQVPVAQFRKPSLIQTKNKKIYANFSNHHGTLCIRIARSSDLLYQILGWIGVMYEAG